MSNSEYQGREQHPHETKPLEEMLKEALKLPFSENLSALSALVKQGAIGDASFDTPDWLVDGTNFHSPIWSCYFGEADEYSVKKIVNFDVQLANGSSLTDPENSEILKWFRLFLVVQIHPRFNGGSRKASTYELLKFNRALHVLDYILMNDAGYFDIGKNGLGMVTVSAMKSFLLNNSGTPVSDYLYEYPVRLTNWFRSKLDEVSGEDINEACQKFPLIKNIPSVEDRLLSFSDFELVKVRTIIALNGWYDLYPGGKRFNPRVFITTEYRNTLHGISLMPRVIPELNLDDSQAREYPGVPVSSPPAPGVTLEQLSNYASAIQKIPVVEAFYGIKGVSTQGFEALNVKTLFELVEQKYKGHFVTIPYPVLLRALGNSFEFFIDNRHAILKATLDVMISVKHHHFDSSPRMRQVEELFFNLSIPEQLQGLGIGQWCIERSSVEVADFYAEVRSNRYLLYCYQVLIGSFLIILGSLGARRQSEIIDLDPLKCLDPPIDPYLIESEAISYCLNYSARKTGTRNQRQVLSVGITRPLAKFIWDLMGFRRRCESAGVLAAKTNLLLWVDQRKVTAGPIKIFSYNQALDMACDYFEMQTVKIDGVDKRYYLRQHQLRRFMALAFYHSSKGNIEALRHWLGHADVEHVYTYISETTPGLILDSVKAEVIVDCLFDDEDSIEGLDSLKQKIIEKYSSADFVARSLNEIEKSYEPLVRRGLKRSNVHLSEIIDQQTGFDEVFGMLTSHSIDLTPEFFAFTMEDGTQENRFNLVLKIEEVHDAR
ncbi:hypothetical protein [Pseudomonas taiwanensis]|uniref:hypothetical protein n=1 Tax=Pseudomonas taiwanensis TaxID=470150 RepID=UPI001645F8B2|nr:hypothetical protein [Pseudomonas taiwanensis]MBC3489411.1 hypothetical protein [Pseudomonas taiwanensis]